MQPEKRAPLLMLHQGGDGAEHGDHSLQVSPSHQHPPFLDTLASHMYRLEVGEGLLLAETSPVQVLYSDIGINVKQDL